jgi:hypothetical protein
LPCRRHCAQLGAQLGARLSVLDLIFDGMAGRREWPGKRASLDARAVKSHDHDRAGDQAPEGHDHGCQKHAAIARPFHRYPPAVEQPRSFAERSASRHQIRPTGLTLREAFLLRSTHRCSVVPGFLPRCQNGTLGSFCKNTRYNRILHLYNLRLLAAEQPRFVQVERKDRQLEKG